MQIPFRKYHGLGNDFVVLVGLKEDLPWDRLTDPGLAADLCRRHQGIGADGLLQVQRPSSDAAHARMRVINADGSEAEMCGNGIRCVAKALHDHLPAFSGAASLDIETGAGTLRCLLSIGPDGLVQAVKVDMGRPSLDREALPMKGEGPFIQSPITLSGHQLMATAVSMGNPHLITFLDPQQDPRLMAEELGPIFERHPDFPNRTNVEFARPLEGRNGLELWVWERGCGLTQACGTGACATAVAAAVTGRHPFDAPLKIRLPGGILIITVEKGLLRVWIEGPAVEVYQGHFTI